MTNAMDIRALARRVAMGATVAILVLLGLVYLGGKIFAPTQGARMIADMVIMGGIERRAVLTGTNTVRIHDRSDADQLVAIVRGHGAEITAARFRSSGRVLITVDREGVERVTRLDTLSGLAVVEDDHLTWFRQSIWSPLGRPAHDWLGTGIDWADRNLVALGRWTRNRLFVGSTAQLWFQPGQTFRDCEGCPEMIVIPGGSFRMGSEAEDAPDTERPARDVTVQPFALGIAEVSRDEFAVFIQESGQTQADGRCFTFGDGGDWLNPGFPQSGDHPVVCISAEDAQLYVDWLNGKVGRDLYRLPSEAELAYAIRAGWEGPGDQAMQVESLQSSCAFLNFADLATKIENPGLGTSDCNDRFAYTAPANAYPANRFGLRNLVGNAWEWTADCWHPSFDGAPMDSRPWTDGDSADCSFAVLRGGSWDDEPGRLRSAYRDRLLRGNRYFDVGFRVARTLTP